MVGDNPDPTTSESELLGNKFCGQLMHHPRHSPNILKASYLLGDIAAVPTEIPNGAFANSTIRNFEMACIYMCL